MFVSPMPTWRRRGVFCQLDLSKSDVSKHRVGDALPELVVHQAGVACQHGPGGLGPQPPVRPHLEAVGLDGPCPLSGEAGPAAELGE